jgi:hypothetical protein
LIELRNAVGCRGRIAKRDTGVSCRRPAALID